MEKERFLNAFLANTPEEAETVYNNFSSVLNKLSYSYSKSTGLDKADLFSEALVGLARAARDFDSKKSDNFKLFALFKIKDAMNNYVNTFSSIVRIPSYIRKTNKNLLKLHSCLISNGIDTNTNSYNKIFFYGTNYSPCQKCINYITNAAKRAGLTYNELVLCSMHLPITTYLKKDIALIEELKINILELKMCLSTPDELLIIEGLLNDKTFKEIGIENNKSASWAYNIFKNIKDKLGSGE